MGGGGGGGATGVTIPADVWSVPLAAHGAAMGLASSGAVGGGGGGGMYYGMHPTHTTGSGGMDSDVVMAVSRHHGGSGGGGGGGGGGRPVMGTAGVSGASGAVAPLSSPSPRMYMRDAAGALVPVLASSLPQGSLSSDAIGRPAAGSGVVDGATSRSPPTGSGASGGNGRRRYDSSGFVPPLAGSEAVLTSGTAGSDGVLGLRSTRRTPVRMPGAPVTALRAPLTGASSGPLSQEGSSEGDALGGGAAAAAASRSSAGRILARGGRSAPAAGGSAGLATAGRPAAGLASGGGGGGMMGSGGVGGGGGGGIGGGPDSIVSSERRSQSSRLVHAVGAAVQRAFGMRRGGGVA